MRIQTWTIAAFAALIGGDMPAGPQAEAPRYSDWSAPVNLGSTVNSAALDGCPAISRDGLSLYFASRRNGGQQDLYVAQRASTSDAWEPPQPLDINHPTADDFCPALSVDGHYLFFASNRPGPVVCGGNDLYVSRRKDKRDDSGWGSPQNLGCVVNSGGNDFGPNYFEDESGTPTLFFSSNGHPGLGMADIFVTKVGSDGLWTVPENVTELNSTAADQQSSILQRDGLEIIFTSNRGGSAGLDLWVATRASQADPWGTPVNLGPINTSAAEARPSLSWDGTELYFHSNRTGGGASGAEDLYVSTRKKQTGSPD